MITEKKEHMGDGARRSEQLFELRRKHHETCPVCGTLNSCGLNAEFEVREDGGVEASVICGETKEGYNGIVHGGVIASLLDGAMTNCLFSCGIVAVTGEMTIRMLNPVSAQVPVVVRAWLDRTRTPLYILSAEMSQNGYISAKAKGKFVDKTYMRRKK